MSARAYGLLAGIAAAGLAAALADDWRLRREAARLRAESVARAGATAVPPAEPRDYSEWEQAVAPRDS